MSNVVRLRRVVILDRDGVLNKMVVDPEHGTIDSPLHPSQVKMASGAAEALKLLSDANYLLAVATNQPSAAKGKTTRENLEAVHRAVMISAQSAGAEIATYRICFHQSGDGCECRKPKPGMLLEILSELESKYGPLDRSNSWMVGDGVTDLQAGRAAELKVAVLAPKKLDAVRILDEAGVSPDFWGDKLADFARFIAGH